MTDYFQGFWLAVLQGITEFLPISSSGHLVLLPRLLGWSDQGLAFDVAVHVGTLIAVVAYFYADLSKLIKEWWSSLFGGPVTAYSRLAWSIAWATVMVGVAGVLLEGVVNQWLRDPYPVAIATMIFALLLWWADRAGTKRRQLEQIGWFDVLMIGSAQVLALIPGTSRSGVTITTGLALGLTREAAARFSFLLAIPVISLAGIWQGSGLVASEQPVNWLQLLFVTTVSALVAFACIHWFLSFLRRFGMLVFVVYRLLLGLLLLWMFR